MSSLIPSMHYECSGKLNKTRGFLNSLYNLSFRFKLEKYGKMGVDALREATPKDTGETANSWGYEIEETKDGITIRWTNSKINHMVPVALLIQYGHETKNGGWVSGIDYINPALKPIFDKIADDAWKEVTSY